MEDSLMPSNMIMEHSYSVVSGSTGPNDKTTKGWEHFDQIISTFLVEQKIPGATVAVSRKGVILYQQGYGVAGAGCRVHEDSMFRIASISKPVTAAIVVQLFDKLKIPLNTKVFGKTGILKSYRTRDKRMKNISVRHLLQHSAGWDRDKVGDAVFVRPQCVVKEHPDSPAYNSALLAYALRRKLQFSPGTWHSYSNLGYLVLGEIIEALSGQPYSRVLQTFLHHLDITGVVVGNRGRTHYKCREVEYFNNCEQPVVNSIYPEEGTVLPQYGGMAMESSASYGGLVADTASLLRFIDSMEEAVNQSNVNQSNVNQSNVNQSNVNQSNTNDYRLHPSSTVEIALNTKTDGEQLGPEVVERHNLYCQQTQELVMKTFEDKLLHGSERVYIDSYNYDHERVNKHNCVYQCNSTDVLGQPGQKQDSSDRQCNSSGIWQTSQVHDSRDRLCHSGNVVYQISQNFISSDIQYNSSVAGCEPGQNFITGDMKHNSIIASCEPCQNLDSSDIQYNSSIVNCEPVQNFDSTDRQYNSNAGIHQSSQFSKTCVDNKCSTCSLKITTRDCSIPNNNSNRRLNTLKPTHLLNATCKKLVQPLMTNKQAIDSLSRPDFENGRDWYGLGWDVQDNGKSWGHTGGMDGSCGTLFHHHSGLNWSFLLNSWAIDADLNGVIKCALCSVSDVGMYGRDILSIDSEFGVRIVTKDNSQIICLCVSESALSKVISHVKADGFFITWISTVSQDFSYVATKLSQGEKSNKLSQHKHTKPGKSEPPFNRYIAVFKKYHIMDYFVLFNKTAIELQRMINEFKKDNFVINFLDSFVDSEAQLRYTAVFKHDSSAHHDNDIIVLLAMAASDYVKSVKSFLCSHYVVVQSVTDVCSQLYVSAILFARNSHGKLTWLPYIVEHSVASCADNPDINTHMNMPVKSANVLPPRNAESAQVYSDINVDSSTELKPLLNDSDINVDSSTELKPLLNDSDINVGSSTELKPLLNDTDINVGSSTELKPLLNDSDINVGSSTELKPLLNDTNSSCSSTLSVLQKSEDIVFQESRELTIFEESKGESVFQGSLEERVFQKSIGETLFQKLGGKTIVQESIRKTGNQESDTICSCETVQVSSSHEHSTRSRTRNKPNCQLKTNKKSKCQSLTSKNSKCQSWTSKKLKRQTSLPNSTYWVQITPESFLTELNRQTKQNNSLVYAQFYTWDRKPYVSGCWYPKSGGNCYHRISMSKYGLLPELVEAASENVYLQSLSEYVEEDGVVYYAAIWQA